MPEGAEGDQPRGEIIRQRGAGAGIHRPDAPARDAPRTDVFTASTALLPEAAWRSRSIPRPVAAGGASGCGGPSPGLVRRAPFGGSKPVASGFQHGACHNRYAADPGPGRR